MKEYVKPELFYEDLQLAQSIARCDWNYDNTHTDKFSCTATMAGISVFVSAGICEVTVSPDEYCLMNSTAQSATFNS